MKINPAIFKAYDIRGVYPTDIDEEVIKRIVQAIYAFFEQKLGKPSFTIALGRDMRISSPALFEVAKTTLLSLGATVVDLGLVPTPTFYFAVANYKYDSGIQITASHNPKEYTGLKFVLNTPTGLLKIGKPTGMDEIKRMAMETVPLKKKSGKLVQKSDVIIDEARFASSVFKDPKVKKLKIVADTANAMGALYIEALAKIFPIDLVRMNFELDGTFPVHQPDPMQPKNLVDLQRRVVEEKADLGLAPDGDGDRLFIIDEKGQVVPPSQIIGILADELLEEYPGSKIVVDQKYYFTPKKIVEGRGGEIVLSKTGHAFITEAMNKTGALFAGEASAHYYYRATGNAESQTITIVGILKILTDKNKPLSEIALEYRKSFESGEMNFEVPEVDVILQSLKRTHHDGDLSTMDGISITYPTWRLSVRSSNTEPLLRLNIEAYEKDLMQEKRDQLVAEIKSLGAVSK